MSFKSIYAKLIAENKRPLNKLMRDTTLFLTISGPKNPKNRHLIIRCVFASTENRTRGAPKIG
jgi:hypothetical protein